MSSFLSTASTPFFKKSLTGSITNGIIVELSNNNGLVIALKEYKFGNPLNPGIFISPEELVFFKENAMETINPFVVAHSNIHGKKMTMFRFVKGKDSYIRIYQKMPYPSIVDIPLNDYIKTFKPIILMLNELNQVRNYVQSLGKEKPEVYDAIVMLQFELLRRRTICQACLKLNTIHTCIEKDEYPYDDPASTEIANLLMEIDKCETCPSSIKEEVQFANQLFDIKIDPPNKQFVTSVLYAIRNTYKGEQIKEYTGIYRVMKFFFN